MFNFIQCRRRYRGRIMYQIILWRNGLMAQIKQQQHLARVPNRRESARADLSEHKVHQEAQQDERDEHESVHEKLISPVPPVDHPEQRAGQTDGAEHVPDAALGGKQSLPLAAHRLEDASSCNAGDRRPGVMRRVRMRIRDSLAAASRQADTHTHTHTHEYSALSG